MIDLPLEEGRWLIEIAQGAFTLLGFGDVELPAVPGLRRIGIDQTAQYPCYSSRGSFAKDRYSGAVLLRPDGHIAATFDKADPRAIKAAFVRAQGKGPSI